MQRVGHERAINSGAARGEEAVATVQEVEAFIECGELPGEWGGGGGVRQRGLCVGRRGSRRQERARETAVHCSGKQCMPAYRDKHDM